MQTLISIIDYHACKVNCYQAPGICDVSVISSVLPICPSVTLKKRSYKGLAPPWKLSQIIGIRFLRKFQGTQILGLSLFSASVWSKIALFAKMSVRYANIFTSLIKTRAWFEIPGVW